MAHVLQLLDAYFADQQATKDTQAGASGPNPNDQFLRSFILNRGWVDQDEAGYVPTYDEVRIGASVLEECACSCV